MESPFGCRFDGAGLQRLVPRLDGQPRAPICGSRFVFGAARAGVVGGARVDAIAQTSADWPRSRPELA
ncbi:CAAX amino terminal protease family domain protein [Synechococcus sp. PROS-9-1]|nr:CAAX amino terminal protease family domain protein [Synechococcus sp. PROS-9-1]